MNLTLEQQATNVETWKHIDRVRQLLNGVAMELLRRGEQHDRSKLASPEVELFTEYTPKLAATTYGSPEYERYRAALGVALQNHYRHNRHHPEHFANGVDDMTLVDLVEMLCDWKAASERHKDGDIDRSITVNIDRFKLSSQLATIFRNTAAAIWRPDWWHCFGCGAGGNDGNFCSMCGAGRHDYEARREDV